MMIMVRKRRKVTIVLKKVNADDRSGDKVMRLDVDDDELVSGHLLSSSGLS